MKMMVWKTSFSELPGLSFLFCIFFYFIFFLLTSRGKKIENQSQPEQTGWIGKVRKCLFLSRCSVSLPSPFRVVYLCNKLPEGARGMLNSYEPDSLTSQSKLMQTQNTSKLPQLYTELYSDSLTYRWRRKEEKKRERTRGDSVPAGGDDTELKFWASSTKFEISMPVASISFTLPPSWLPFSIERSCSLIGK